MKQGSSELGAKTRHFSKREISEGILVLVYANHKSEYGPFFKFNDIFTSINILPLQSKQLGMFCANLLRTLFLYCCG
jgi:hypothetical protein